MGVTLFGTFVGKKRQPPNSIDLNQEESFWPSLHRRSGGVWHSTPMMSWSRNSWIQGSQKWLKVAPEQPACPHFAGRQHSGDVIQRPGGAVALLWCPFFFRLHPLGKANPSADLRAIIAHKRSHCVAWPRYKGTTPGDVGCVGAHRRLSFWHYWW